MTAPPKVDEAAPAPALDGDALARIKAKLVTPMPSDRLRGWLLPLAVTFLAGILRFWRLTRPGGHAMTSSKDLVFDETYYAHDSWTLLHHGVEGNGPGTGAGFVVHPPLGKWMMALGEAALDHGKTVTFHHTVYPANPLSFRIMGAILGTLAVLMVARIARRMFRSTALGVIAGIVFSLDGLEFVQSRTAMLDIYLMFWVLAAFGCLILDRDDGRRRLADRLTGPLDPARWGPSLGLRPWRLAAGICIGAACGTKWDGAYYIPAFLILAVAWDIQARRTAGIGLGTGLGRGIAFALGPALVTFIVIPAAVYVACWTGWFMSNGQYAYDHDVHTHPGQSWLAHDWGVWRGWWHYQSQIWDYANGLTWDKNPHPYLSRPYGWLALSRPVAYYYQAPKGCGAATCSQEILGIGNPAIWWATAPALIATAWTWISRRDWRASAILGMFAFGFLPWFYEDTKHRVMFLFYMLPNVPFMALALTMAVGLMIGSKRTSTFRQTIGLSAAAVYLVIVVVTFGFFYPVLAGRNIPYSQWQDRMWFGHVFGNSCQTGKNVNTHHENAFCWI